MDSGTAPLLLKKNQAAALINATVRGAFAGTRPAFQRCSLTFASAALQTLVERTLFQGAGYYRPDFGTEQLLAALGGRLFAFIESNTPRNFTVTDISVPGDPNDATVGQTCMWQSEKWMVATDGTAKLPIFYDGATSRRSYGPSVLLAVANSFFPANPPAIGGTVAITTVAPYSGPYNVPVLMNGAFYQINDGAGGGSSATLTNLAATVGSIIPTGSNVVTRGAAVGKTSAAATSTTTVPHIVTVTLSAVDGLLSGDSLSIAGVVRNFSSGTSAPFIAVFQVNSINTTTRAVTMQYVSGGTVFLGESVTVPANAVTQKTTGAPDVIIGTTTAPFVNPASGGTVAIQLGATYSGPDGAVVWIGDDQYTIAAPAPPAPSSNLVLTNLSDTGSATPYDATEDILSVPELPAGRMGAYGLGQNWMSLTDGLSFIVSDPVGGASGTPANQYRDAVLKYTELTFRGGNFRIPTAGTIISSMTFTSVLDVALGQGPLIIGTDSGMYSCIAPVNFTSLPNISGPILTPALIGQGPLGQNSTILVNSDILFRTYPGLASLVLARREFASQSLGGNTPISHEMERIFNEDDRTLLQYSSAIVFNNRFLVTARPQVGPQGVFHSGLVAINLDPVSSLRGKLPSVYDGAWSGLNVMQLVQGKINGAQRAFAFCYNVTEAKLELYELLADGVEDLDNGSTPIPMVIETAVLFNADTKPINELVRLLDGELFLQDLPPGKKLHIKIQYRPDFFPCWIDWREWDICSAATATQPGYRTRIGIGEPGDVPCEEGNNRRLNIGHFMQCRIELTGKAKFMALRVKAADEPMSDFAPPECSEVCSE